MQIAKVFKSYLCIAMWLLGLLASTQQNVSEDREFKNKVSSKSNPLKNFFLKGNFD